MMNWFGPFGLTRKPFYACAWLGPIGVLIRNHEAYPPLYSERNGFGRSFVIGPMRFTVKRRKPPPATRETGAA